METGKYFIQSNSISSGQVFIDSLTGITFGIRHINYERLATGSITLPNSQPLEFNEIQPGHKWNFTFNNRNFELTLIELNYLYDSFKVQLVEK
mgnify:CR=1 FL=1